MVDGFKCSCVGLSADVWQHNPLLDFGLSVSESTGELLSQRKEAKFRALYFVISPTKGGKPGCSMYGSFHKQKNENLYNWDDFYLSEVCNVLDYISYIFDVDLNKAILHSLEIGVNIRLNYSPKSIIQSVICHKGKSFSDISKREKSLGVICEHTDYAIKLYDKGHQSRIENGYYILRYEVKFKRLRMLEPFGISNLSDLKEPDKMKAVEVLLLDKLKEIVFFDFQHNTSNLTDKQRLNWERYSNPKYWEGLNRKQYYNARVLHAELTEKYGAIDRGAKLANKVSETYQRLIDIKPETVGHFPQVSGESVSANTGTFSELEYVLENVPSGDENLQYEMKERKEEKQRHCLSCGRNISHQKKGSTFCSEKYFGKDAKICRNKDSNRRMLIKRKIKKVMDKNLMLRITYTDEVGKEYADTLGVNEIKITREWLDRVKSVDILKPEPERLEGEKAKKLLLTI